MFRADTSPGAAFYGLAVTPRCNDWYAVYMHMRPTAGAVISTYFLGNLSYSSTLRLRIAREGTAYTSYYSTDGGTTWTYLGNSGATLTAARVISFSDRKGDRGGMLMF